MKHKLEMLHQLVKTMSARSAGRMKSHAKPIVSVSVMKHDELPEEDMLHEKMESPLEEHNEENELSLSDDKDGRKALMKRFGK